MRRLSILAFCVALLSVSFLSKSGAIPIRAYSIVSGCDYINANGAASVDNELIFGGALAFNAGETITVTQNGGDGIVIYNIATSAVYAASTASSVSWTVPTSGNWELAVGANIHNGALVAFSCKPYSSSSVSTDGRLNNSDAAETFAAYCQTDGSIRVYGIDYGTSKGFLAFTVTAAEIAKVPTKPTVNTAIKSGGGATLYRLTSGELQINRPEEKTGKMYAFIFGDCAKN